MSEATHEVDRLEDADGVPVTVGVDHGRVTVASPGAALDAALLEWLDRALAAASQDAGRWRREHGHEDAACPNGPGWHERAVGCEDGGALCRHCARDLRGEQHQIGCPGWDENRNG